MNIKQNVPILGQPQGPFALQAVALVTPELKEKLEAWCEKIGLPVTEIQNTIFRLGLIVFSITATDESPITEGDATNLIPLTDNEKKAFRTYG